MATVAADNFGRTEMDLKRPGNCDVCFKSVPEITSSENVLAFQNRKFSEHTSHSSMSSFNADIPLNLAIDDSIRDNIVNINTRPNMPTDLGAGTGNTIRNLRPR